MTYYWTPGQDIIYEVEKNGKQNENNYLHTLFNTNF